MPFYGTVYKSICYDLIIPFPRGRNGKNDVRLFLRPGRPEKANNLIINSLWIVFYAEWHQLQRNKKGSPQRAREEAVFINQPDNGRIRYYT